MVTSWPRSLPGPGTNAQRIADRIRDLSNGRLVIELFAAGELVPPFEVFDAVAGGTAEMAHTASFFWQGKTPAAVFFTVVPFGLTPLEHHAWIEQGGGQALWDTLYAPFGIKPFMAGNAGVQMGGWYTREITSLDSLKGLRIRMPGLGGEVLRRLGATPIALPPGEIFSALNAGTIDATDFLGPWSDAGMGFFQVAKLYYAPGFHKPNGTAEALVSQAALERLPSDLRAIVEAACRIEAGFSLSRADWMNASALRRLVREHNVEVRVFPRDVVAALRETSRAVVAEFAQAGDIEQRIHASYLAAGSRLGEWTDVSLKNFLDARGAWALDLR